MTRTFTLAVAAVASIALTAGGVAYAGSTVNQITLPAVTPHTNATGVTVQTEFVPITPCRIVDTRNSTGGILKAEVTRSFIVGGTSGFPNQGGHTNGCGIPVGASAVSASITATGITGTGIIHAWPVGKGEPNATVLNYNKVAGSVTTGVDLAINPAGGAALDVKAKGANTQFVVDAVGYYREPIAVHINSDGTMGVHSSQITSTGRNPGNSTGVYVVNSAAPIQDCIVTATPTTTSTLLITTLSTGSTSFLVIVRNPSNSSLVDSPVDVAVTC